MRFKKIIFYIIIIFSVIFVYKITYSNKIDYLVLGDSISLGRNSYGEIGYSYTDYIRDYLENNNRLGSYIKEYATNGYKINNIINDINNNKKINYKEGTIRLMEALRESDLVTLTIGANDFFSEFTFQDLSSELNNIDKLKVKINNISDDFEDLLILLKKYAKGKIIVTGYYNPLPYFTEYKQIIDELVIYSNKKYKEICNENDVYFIDIFDSFDQKKYYLSNPYDVHPNIFGYEQIFIQIKNVIDKVFFIQNNDFCCKNY